MIKKQAQVEVQPRCLWFYPIIRLLKTSKVQNWDDISSNTFAPSPSKPSIFVRIHSNTGSCSDSVLTPAALASDHWMSCQSTVGLSLWLLLIDEDCSEHLLTDHQTECNPLFLCQYRLVQLFQPHLGSANHRDITISRQGKRVCEPTLSHQVHQLCVMIWACNLVSQRLIWVKSGIGLSLCPTIESKVDAISLWTSYQIIEKDLCWIKLSTHISMLTQHSPYKHYGWIEKFSKSFSISIS